MKKLFCLLFLLFSFSGFAAPMNMQLYKNTYLDNTVIHMKENLTGKVFITKDGFNPATYDKAEIESLFRETLLVKDNDKASELAVENRVKSWYKKGIGGITNAYAEVKVVKDLRTPKSPIILVQDAATDDDTPFYMFATGLITKELYNKYKDK